MASGLKTERAVASMRPPEFTGGNRYAPCGIPLNTPCFNEAAGIHRRKPAVDRRAGAATAAASMRPPEFTGGNPPQRDRGRRDRARASMRPPEFTGGNHDQGKLHAKRQRVRFNEAAGIHRRKPVDHDDTVRHRRRASMRPPEFTGGNQSTMTTRSGIGGALQ